MKLLIVDDERQIREGMREGIDWAELGFAQVDAAADGLEAWALFVRERLEIVVSVIRFPEMVGLVLAEQIKALCPRTTVIILSGFSDFEYARQALRVGVTDYELKPVNAQRIMVLVTSAAKKISGERARAQDEAFYEHFYMRSQLDSLLNRAQDSREKEDEFRKYLHFFASDIPVCGLFRLPKALAQEAYIPLEALTRSLRTDFCGQLHPLRGDQFLLLFCARDRRAIDRIYAQLVLAVKQLVASGIPAFLAFGASEDSRTLCEALRFALIADSCRLYPGHGACARYDALSLRPEALQCYFTRMKELRECVREVDFAGAVQLIRAEFDRLEREGVYHETAVKALCANLTGLLKNTIAERGMELHHFMQSFLKERDDLGDRETFSGYQDATAQLFDQALRALSGIFRQEGGTQILRVVNFIKEHYGESLTAEQMSQMINRTPNYFSLLFKKSTGSTFHQYLTRVRIDRAKALMEDGTLLVYEIAENVGFRDYKYFAKIFKQIEHCSLSEYGKTLGRR
ncbi:MAG: response regulator [Clostridia bacterium]